MNLQFSYIVLQNYSPPSDCSKLYDVPFFVLWIGERLRVVSEYESWCYGHYEGVPNRLGLFPKTHIQEIRSFIEANSSVSEAQQLIDEITNTVKIWWQYVKSLYCNNNCTSENSEKFVKYIKDLMIIRNKLRSGNVPTGELKEIRLTIARKIDIGNHYMGLNMHIRNEVGKVIRAEELSVVNAYRQHELAYAKLTNDSLENQKSDKFSILVNINLAGEIKNCPYNAEFAVSLINAKSSEVVSETLTLHWIRSTKKFAYDSCRGLFVDLTFKELCDDNLLLSIKMFKLASIDFSLSTSSKKSLYYRNDSNNACLATSEFRQLHAHGDINVSEVLRDIYDKEKREVLLNLVRLTQNQHNSSSLISLNSATSTSSKPFPLFFSNKQVCNLNHHNQSSIELSSLTAVSSSTTFDYKIPLIVTFQLIAGPLESIHDYNPSIFLSTSPPPPAILQKIRPTSLKSVLDFRRNEFYLFLKSADIRIGKSSSSSINSAADKNFEAILTLWDGDGNQLNQCFETISSEKIIYSNSFRSSVTICDDRPNFDETVKIILPNFAVKSLHVRILFYNRRAYHLDKNVSENGVRKSTMPVALSYLNLIQYYALVPDSSGFNLTGAGSSDDLELLVYKIDLSKFDEHTIAYLRLNSKRQNLVPKHSSAGVSNNTLNLTHTSYGAFTLAEKAAFIVRYNAVSAIHTKSVRLLHIFRWRQIGATSAMLNDRIHDVIDGAIGVNGYDDSAEMQTDELLKFLPAFLDALFQIAADDQMAAKSYLTVFDAVVYIIRLCDEPKNAHFTSVLNNYVDKFCFTTAHDFLLHNLTWYIENEGQNRRHQVKQGSSRDRLLPVLKSLGLITRLIVVSKHCYYSFSTRQITAIEKTENASNLFFSGKIDLLLQALALLIRSGSTARMTCQNVALKYFPLMIEPLIQYKIYEPLKLTRFIVLIVDDLSDDIILRQKLTFIADIIETELFASKECRKLLLPKFLDELLSYMTSHLWNTSLSNTTVSANSMSTINRQQSAVNRGAILSTSMISADSLEIIELSAKIITDLVEKLFPYSRSRSVFQRGTAEELRIILFKLLRPVNQTVIVLLNDPMHQRALHTLLLSLLDKFSAENFLKYFNSLPMNIDRLDMLSEMLNMFRDLLQRNPLPTEWYQMCHLQHRLFVKFVRFSAALIVDKFGGKHHLSTYTYQNVNIDNRAKNERFRPMPCDDLECQFVPDIWLECMLTTVSIVKSLMTVITTSIDNNVLDSESSSFNVIYKQSNCDMCERATTIMRSLWFSMGVNQKMLLFPRILGSVLEIALCENDLLRGISIPIFYDMLETEHFYFTKIAVFESKCGLTDCQISTACNLTVNCLSDNFNTTDNSVERTNSSNYSTNLSTRFSFRDSVTTSNNTLSSRSFVDEFITQLDPLLDSYCGGPAFRAKFNEMFMARCQLSPSMRLTPKNCTNFGIKFVEKVDKLLELLLNYRQVRLNSDCIENGMFCTVQLIDFYQKIGQNALYVSYLYKLYDLHMMSGNNVEAALTLKKHSNLLKWSDDKLESYLVAKPMHKSCETHVKLKERIYIEMADLFDRGEHWEQAVNVLKELIPVYENILYDYVELAELLHRLSKLYKKITSTIRMENNYFLVAFYGKQAPPYLAGKKFVFRGEKLEQWNSFKQRMLHNYYSFKFVDSVDNCDEQYSNVDDKFMQIIPITAQPSVTYSHLNKSPHRLTRWYYKHNKIQHFEQLRRETNSDTKWTKLDNNDATKLWIKRKYISIAKPLPDILNFAPVVSEFEPELANPVEVALLKIQEVNDQLTETAQLVAAGFVQFLVNLGGLVRGVVQADVGGGIRNYEPFFTNECWHDATETERKSIMLLKTLLREHVMILEYALYVHASKHPQINDAFHNSLVDIFASYRRNIEERFGKVKSILPVGASIHLYASSSAGIVSSGGSIANLLTANTTITSVSSSFQSSQAADLSSTNNGTFHSPNHNVSNLSINGIADCPNANTGDKVDGSFKYLSFHHTSIPFGNSTNVLFRHVPSAATLLRSTMNRSKTLTNSSTMTGNLPLSSLSHLPSPSRKQGLKVLTRMVSNTGVSPMQDSLNMTTTSDLSVEQQKAENLAIISALRVVTQSRFSSDSMNLDDLLISECVVSDADSVKQLAPPLPPRVSLIHSTELLPKI